MAPVVPSAAVDYAIRNGKDVITEEDIRESDKQAFEGAMILGSLVEGPVILASRMGWFGRAARKVGRWFKGKKRLPKHTIGAMRKGSGKNPWWKRIFKRGKKAPKNMLADDYVEVLKPKTPTSGKKLYRGTTGSEDNLERSLYLTDDPDVARSYLKNGGTLKEYNVDNVELERLWGCRKRQPLFLCTFEDKK